MNAIPLKSLLQILIILTVICILSACKLAIVSVEGGEVQSQASGTCAAGTICIIEVTDASFSEVFEAVPQEGWRFRRWNSGQRLLCGRSTIPQCGLSFENVVANPNLDVVLASSETFYLMPVFKPDTDVIEAGGKAWLQPDLFQNMTWEEIHAVCPLGVCPDGAQLRGRDMTGWRLASVDDLNSLFNGYMGGQLLGHGHRGFMWGRSEDGEMGQLPNRYFVDDFYDAGWRPLHSGPIDDGFPRNNPNYIRMIQGWAWNAMTQSPAWMQFRHRLYPWGSDIEVESYDGTAPSDTGAWFCRNL
jgi:hypothetical protein